MFAAVFVTLFIWFIVLPLKGSPVGGGFRMPGVVVAPLVYSFRGLGMWLISSALHRPHGASPAPAKLRLDGTRAPQKGTEVIKSRSG